MNLFQSVNNAMSIALDTDETAGLLSLSFLLLLLSLLSTGSLSVFFLCSDLW